MRRFYYCLLLLNSLLLTANNTHANAVEHHAVESISVTPLDIRQNYDDTGLYTRFMLETGNSITLDQAIASFQAGHFQPVNKPVAGFGLTPHGTWLRLQVHNPTGKTLLRRLTMATPWLGKVDLYILRDTTLLNTFKTGNTRPLSSRQIEQRLFSFQHAFAPGDSDIYLRIETHEPMILPISFRDLETSVKQDTLAAYGYGLLYGIIGGLLLFNLTLYLSIRQRRYLFYALYLSMYLFNNFAYTGHGYFYLWQDASGFQYWADSLTITLYSTAGVLFALSFLRIKELFPRLHFYTLIACVLICALQLIFITLDMGMASVKAGVLYLMTFSLVTFYYAIISYKKGNTDAVYYMVATIATLLAAAATPLSVLDIIPFSPLTFHAGEIAVAFDSILLSIALAGQIRRAQNETQHAHKLARTDILTRLNNRLAFDEISKNIWLNSSQNSEKLCFIMLDIDKFKEINDLHGHAVGDTVLKSLSSVLDEIVREDDVLVRWGGEEFAIVLPKTSLKQACKLAERIRKAIEDLQIQAGDTSINTTVSLGVAEKTEDIKTIDELFAVADNNLYQAKQAGRNRVHADSKSTVKTPTAGRNR